MDRETARKKITNLREEIEYHNKLYYDDNENIISDYDYDLKMNDRVLSSSILKPVPLKILNR